MTRTAAFAAFAVLAAACGTPQGELSYKGPNPSWGTVELPCDDATVNWPGFLHVIDGRAGDLSAWSCGRVEMPWDASNPEDTLSLGYVRLPAADPAKRRGTLVFNPGGPGGSGTSMAPAVASILPAEVLEAYDIVGFDPRGTNWTEEVACQWTTDDDLTLDFSPETREELEALDLLLEDTMVACREENPRMTQISSNRVVDDMEALRVHLGEEQLDFLGYSYGTRLASLYAEAYPDRVGHFVLDASTPPDTTFLETLDGQNRFHNDRIDQLIDECTRCGPDFTAELGDLLAELDASPEGVELGGRYRTEDELRGYLGEAVAGDVTAFDELVVPMVNGDYAALDQALAGRFDHSLLDDPTMIFRTLIVNCLDDAQRPTFDEVYAAQTAALDGSLMGSSHHAALACRHALTDADLDPIPVVTGDDAPPMVVVGGTLDANTPYEWSVEMANALEQSVLVTSEHVGHTAVGSSECVDEVVASFLLDDELPTSDVDCPAP